MIMKQKLNDVMTADEKARPMSTRNSHHTSSLQRIDGMVDDNERAGASNARAAVDKNWIRPSLALAHLSYVAHQTQNTSRVHFALGVGGNAMVGPAGQPVQPQLAHGLAVADLQVVLLKSGAVLDVDHRHGEAPGCKGRIVRFRPVLDTLAAVAVGKVGEADDNVHFLLEYHAQKGTHLAVGCVQV